MTPSDLYDQSLQLRAQAWADLHSAPLRGGARDGGEAWEITHRLVEVI
jgi:hypothetical protein